MTKEKLIWEVAEELSERTSKIKSVWNEENTKVKERIELVAENDTLIKRNQQLEDRINKAIAYTETLYSEGEICRYQNNKFIDILKGEE